MAQNLFFRDIESMAEMIRHKKVSSIELTDALLDRISKIDPVLNAFIMVAAEDARAQAKDMEDELISGKIRGPLHGVPFAIKDIFTTKDRITTAGSRILADWVPDVDSTAVRRLKDAGAIIIGKTNLHEFAMGATTENPHYGPSRNPWDMKRIAGGSSGGSAVAVATGMCYGALGTDTGGSIRFPAAVCGIVGLKPTYGRVSRHGVLPLSWSLDHVGPMTRTVKDAAYMLHVLAGADPLDGSCAKHPVDNYVAALSGLGGRLKEGLRIGIIREHFFEGVDPEMGAIIQQAIEVLTSLGAQVVELSVPYLQEALVAQRAISQSEGYTYHEKYLETSSDLYGEDVRFRLGIGKGITASQYLNAQRIRGLIRHSFLDVLNKCDLIVAPTNSNPAFEIGTVGPEESINNMFKLGKTPLGNLLGFPSLSVPCGFTSEKLPVGLQLIGAPFAEKLLLQVGYVYEQATEWYKQLEQNRAYVDTDVAQVS